MTDTNHHRERDIERKNKRYAAKVATFPAEMKETEMARTIGKVHLPGLEAHYCFQQRNKRLRYGKEQ